MNNKDEMPVIFTYTRAEALKDGVLFDVTYDAKGYGIKYPTAITAGVEAKLEMGKGRTESELHHGRLRDVLYMFAMKARVTSEDTIYFTVKIGRENVDLWAKCGPGDTMEPVISIMLVGED